MLCPPVQAAGGQHKAGRQQDVSQAVQGCASCTSTVTLLLGKPHVLHICTCRQSLDDTYNGDCSIARPT